MSAAPILEIFKNGEALKSVSVDGELNVGRGEGCGLRLDDRAVSRQHASIRSAKKGLEVVRQSEFAPIRVNGVDKDSAILSPGDVIDIGPYRIKVTATGKSPEVIEPVVESKPEILEITAEPISAPVNEPINLSFDTESEPQSDFQSDSEQQAESDLQAEAEADSVLESTAESEAVNLDFSPSVAMSAESDERTKVFTSVNILVRLLLPEGAAQAKEFDLTKDETVIGRGNECDVILLEEKKASRKHAIIRKKGLNFVLEDLGTPNGTLLNGRTIEEASLADGDIIQIGEVKIQFSAQAPDEYVPEQDSTVASTMTESVSGGTTMMPGAVSGETPEETRFVEAAKSMFLNLNSGATSVVQVGEEGPPPEFTSVEGASIDTLSESASLADKIKAKWKNPKERKKIILGVTIAALLMTLLFPQDEEKPAQKSVDTKTETTAIEKLQVTTQGLEGLSDEQRAFVQARYQAAMKYYQNNEFDPSLFELNKIFEIVPEYEPARELQKYVLEGKRRMQVLEDEKKRKEDEVKIKAKIAEIEGLIEKHMSDKKYQDARELFPTLLQLDPNTTKIAEWEKIISDEADKKRREEERKQVEAEMNKKLWSAYQLANLLRKQGRCNAAIEAFAEVLGLQATDRKPYALARSGIAACRRWIQQKRDPYLAQARQFEAEGDLGSAFRSYLQANKIDPGNAIAVAGMSRIRGTLHERAKVLFSEGLVAETFSDFDTAFKKYQDTLNVAPPDDDFYGRALRKLNRYRRQRVFAERIEPAETANRLPGSVSVPEGSYSPADPSQVVPNPKGSAEPPPEGVSE